MISGDMGTLIELLLVIVLGTYALVGLAALAMVLTIAWRALR